MSRAPVIAAGALMLFNASFGYWDDGSQPLMPRSCGLKCGDSRVAKAECWPDASADRSGTDPLRPFDLTSAASACGGPCLPGETLLQIEHRSVQQNRRIRVDARQGSTNDLPIAFERLPTPG
jgi:hypothetical protein